MRQQRHVPGGVRIMGWLVGVIVVLLAGLVSVHLLTHGSTPAIRDEHGEVIPGSIALLKPIELRGGPQWVLVRGRDTTKPILLFLHGGPGMPAMYLRQHMSPDLERDFIVVHWDRLASGKTLALDPTPDLSVSQMVDDTCEVAQLMRARFGGRRIVLVGHSWGTYLGMLAVQRHPELFSAYVGVGQVAGLGRRDPEELRMQRDYIIARAREAGVERDLGDLEDPGTREKWLVRFGAEMRGTTSYWPFVWMGLTAPEYTLGDALRITRGPQWSKRMRYDVIAGRLDEGVTDVRVPVWFFIGRHDYTTPYEMAQRYLEKLQAPRKELVWFERSAHFPFLEEPDRFAAEMRKVAAMTASP